MKKIGIIGGAGPLASSLLYESIVRECYGVNVDVPEIFIINFPFTRCLTEEEKQTSTEQVLNELSYCIRSLERHGVEIGLLACNTMHIILKQLPPSSIEFHYLPELVLQSARNDGVRELLFFGSQNSCRYNLYQDPSIRMVYPSEGDQGCIDQVIDRVLEGRICQQDAAMVGRIIDRIATEFAIEGVILGCTDLPVLHHHFPIPSKIKIYDSIKLPAKSIGGSL